MEFEDIANNKELLKTYLDDIGSMLSVIDEEKDVDNELRLTKEKILRKTN